MLRDLRAWRWAWAAREHIRDEIYAGAFLGAKGGAGIVAVSLLVFRIRGMQLNRKRRVRGAEFASPRQLRRRVHSCRASWSTAPRHPFGAALPACPPSLPASRPPLSARSPRGCCAVWVPPQSRRR